MPCCVLRKCKNHGKKIKKDDGVTYHTFPSDELLRHKWANKVRVDRCELDWMPSKSSTICSAHFEAHDKYTTPKGYVRLKKCAVPVISSDIVLRVSTPTSLDDVNISDTDSIFDSPEKATLKKQVRKLELDKKELQKKNKVLKSRNIRLTKKIANLKNFVKILKKIKCVSDQQFSDLCK